MPCHEGEVIAKETLTVLKEKLENYIKEYNIKYDDFLLLNDLVIQLFSLQ